MTPLQKRMKSLKIKEEDLIEKFILGSGSGGQKVNKTNSCVFLKHIPTGVQVKCQSSRSREFNREIALTRLCDRLEEIATSAKREEIHAREKLRRQIVKRSFLGQAKVLETKKKQSLKKKLRRDMKNEEE